MRGDGPIRNPRAFFFQVAANLATDYRRVENRRLELLLTPTTLVSGGISYTHQDSVPWNSGLPRYENGDDLELPRSVCLCLPWNDATFRTTELFAQVEQKLGTDWK